jgi:hypothetical protein
VIFGRYGGPSSTSIKEARILGRSSTLLGSQVVRPRNPRSGRRLGFFIGREPSSNLLSDFGGNAWRSPTTCGGVTPVLDCSFSLLIGCFLKSGCLIFKYYIFRARFVKASLQFVPDTCSMSEAPLESSRSFLFFLFFGIFVVDLISLARPQARAANWSPNPTRTGTRCRGGTEDGGWTAGCATSKDIDDDARSAGPWTQNWWLRRRGIGRGWKM